MREILTHLRFGARALARSPGYVAVVVVTLGLAIGANTLIFSFADLFLLQPLPIGDPNRTVFVYGVDAERGVSRGSTSLPDFLDWKRRTSAFEAMGAFGEAGVTLTGAGEPARLVAMRTTANLPAMWGLRTVAGRTFLPNEDAPGAPGVVILSHRFWRQRFASNPSVVGRSIALSGRPYTIVGVLAPDIEIGNLTRLDVWIPLVNDALSWPRDDRSLRVSARLKPGASVDEANAELAAVAADLARAYPRTNGNWSAHALKLRSAIVGPDAALVLTLLAVVVGFVLVIACANVANMMLARASARRRELAVRMSLGATRLRLGLQLIGESMWLGVIGGGLGLLIAQVGIRLLQSASQEPFFRLLALDTRVLAFTAVLSLLAPLLFSTVPALHASRGNPSDALKDGGHRASGGSVGRRSRAALVVAQLGLALTLLVAAGLITRTVAQIEQAPTGIEASNVLTAQMQLEAPKYRSASQITAFADQLIDRLRAVPGARDVTVTNRMPLVTPEPAVRFRIEGRPDPTPKEMPWANAVSIAGDYSAVFKLHVDAGRTLSAHDNATAANVAWVSRETVRRYWPNESPVGRHIELVAAGANRSTRVEIVGVVDDVKGSELTDPAPPRLYRPLSQAPDHDIVVAVRTEESPSALAGTLREAIRAEDADLALSDIRSLDDRLRDQFRENRVLVGMFASFALVALLLSATGLYGVTSYSVSQRAQEIGIRLALGATGAEVLRMVVAENARLVALGALAGAAGGALFGYGMRSILYRVGAADPATFAGVFAVMTVVMLAASYLPARRAAKVDPLTALRAE